MGYHIRFSVFRLWLLFNHIFLSIWIHFWICIFRFCARGFTTNVAVPLYIHYNHKMAKYRFFLAKKYDHIYCNCGIYYYI